MHTSPQLIIRQPGLGQPTPSNLRICNVNSEGQARTSWSELVYKTQHTGRAQRPAVHSHHCQGLQEVLGPGNWSRADPLS